MTMTTRRALAGLALAGSLIAACGGSTPTSSSASAAATTPPSTSPTGAPTSALSIASAPPAAPTTVPTAAPTTSTGVDLGGAAAALSEITSYKLVITTEGGPRAGTATYITIREPVPARSFESNFGGAVSRVIIIGQDVWVDGGSGLWVKNAIPLVAAEAMMGAFDPATLFLGLAAWTNSGGLQQIGTEEKNGVQAVHYHLDSSTVPPGTDIPDDATIDVWVAADGGYLVSMQVLGISSPDGPTNIAMDVTNINDPSLAVLPPT